MTIYNLDRMKGVIAMGNNYMAVDIGEKEGKQTLGYLVDGKLQLEKVHQFEIKQKEVDGVLKTDQDSVINGIKEGLAKCMELGRLPVLVGINEWDGDIVQKLCYISPLFPLVTKPGSVIGSLALEVTEEVGYDCIVVIPYTKHIATELLEETGGIDHTAASLLSLMIFSHELPDLEAARKCMG